MRKPRSAQNYLDRADHGFSPASNQNRFDTPPVGHARKRRTDWIDEL
jgi:hypothetical protein